MFFIFNLNNPKKILRIVKRRTYKKKRTKSIDNSWKQYIEPAYNLVQNIINEVTKLHNFEFKDIKIRNQKTRWGSCSNKGNLNFNYKIVKLPYDLAKYLVIHELCHLKHLDHSKNFWNLVNTLEPNYKRLQKELKAIRL